MKTVSNLLSAALAVSLLTPALTLAQAKPPAVAKTAPATTAANAPTEKEIADAKAKGMVWVDTKSGVYFHRGRSFGKTVEGKFMSEADAKSAGYHSARQGAGKHAAPPTTQSK